MLRLRLRREDARERLQFTQPTGQRPRLDLSRRRLKFRRSKENHVKLSRNNLRSKDTREMFVLKRKRRSSRRLLSLAEKKSRHSENKDQVQLVLKESKLKIGSLSSRFRRRRLSSLKISASREKSLSTDILSTELRSRLSSVSLQRKDQS